MPLAQSAGALRNAEILFITIASRFTLTGVVATDRVLSMNQKEVFDI